ncbi:ABC transporter ATP-binding protein [Ignavigranum ruoffiae]|uniref:Putative hydroxymethylpyrimidine transport system ATP-binding protein n=1 Tax=Ignavigranum ruoffiae TaxID=89093 RepID=A0A1H9GLB0_9LACT|nr:ABC transporter ATP-binding protein [Ignavigranum ruoffiae]SEQ50804.1 putative hydroxymethylpyrimidine transport system ATP-binding protein [Ignavigranum ruoffiae]
MLQIRNLDFSFHQNSSRPIFKQLNLDLPEGEFISLVGKSGSGKSTLFKLISQQYQADQGEITFRGRPVAVSDLAYMPQKDLLLPWANILDNVCLSAKLGPRRPIPRERALAWLAKAGLADDAYALPSQLSGGMRQRAAFVRTILANREILLLDEPFGALDSFTQQEMQTWLLEIWQELKQTVLMITHNLEEAVLLSNRVYVLQPFKANQEAQIRSFQIDLPKDRQMDIRYHPDFIAYKHQIEEAIYG